MRFLNWNDSCFNYFMRELIALFIIFFGLLSFGQENQISKSNLENLTMRVGETFKPTSFAEDLQGQKTLCQAVIYYNKKGVFSTAKAVTVNREKGTIRANEPGTHEIFFVRRRFGNRLTCGGGIDLSTGRGGGNQ